MLRRQTIAPPTAADWADRATYGAIFVLGAILFWMSHSHPSLMPFWAPWDFSLSIYLATALTFYWFWRGLALSPHEAQPPIWRRIAFLLGVLLVLNFLRLHEEASTQDSDDATSSMAALASRWTGR